MNTLPPFDHGRPTGYVLCADERFRRFLENELEQTGVRPLSVSAPSAIPAESLPSCVILWDTDHFPAPTTPPPCGTTIFFLPQKIESHRKLCYTDTIKTWRKQLCRFGT